MSSIVREALEENYNCPIKSKKFREHYVSDKQKYYLCSVKLKTGKYYVVESHWMKTFLYGYQLWFVFQTTKLVNSEKEINTRVRELNVEYGPNYYYKYISENLKIKKTKIEVTQKFNNVSGPLLNNYKNSEFSYDKIVRNFYNHKIRFDFKSAPQGCYVTLNLLTELEMCWVYNFVRIDCRKQHLFLNYKNQNIQFFIRTSYINKSYNENYDKVALMLKRHKKNTLLDLVGLIQNLGE